MAESKEARNKALVLQRLTFVPHSCPRSTWIRVSSYLLMIGKIGKFVLPCAI